MNDLIQRLRQVFRIGDKCSLSGYYWETERKYPTTCKTDYEGWIPRVGLLERIKQWLKGVKP